MHTNILTFLQREKKKNEHDTVKRKAERRQDNKKISVYRVWTESAKGEVQMCKVVCSGHNPKAHHNVSTETPPSTGKDLLETSQNEEIGQ